jgi:peptidoglycan/xylan/chitin deacetylase (PgdA/CDA1 family)
LLPAMVFTLLLLVQSAIAGRIAVTIDDMPFLRGWQLTPVEEAACFRSVLQALEKYDITAFGFVNGDKIKPYHLPLLDEFTAAGHLIGNHTNSHPDLNDTDVVAYLNDIAAGQKAIECWQTEGRYFRYPYLHRGPTAAMYDSVSAYLKAHGYVIIPVSIDNADWAFNRDYSDALQRGDSATADSVGREYLTHMKERTRYFDSIAVAITGRDISHILLLHMTRLNATYLDLLLGWYRDQGWEFISPAVAVSDSVYRQTDSYRGHNGISWLLRLQPSGP